MTAKSNRLIYALGSLLSMILCWWLFCLRIVGRRHVPMQGSLLIIANHQSFLDPVIVGLAVKRQVCYLARKSLFKNRLLGWLMHRLGTIPLDQEGNATEGMKTSLQLLRRGEAVVLFPEGSRTPHGRMQPLKSGVVLLLRKAKVPVLPVGIAGAYQALPIWRKYPHVAPLGWPGLDAGIAAVIGPVIPCDKLLNMPTEAMLTYLGSVRDDLRQQADKIRKKA